MNITNLLNSDTNGYHFVYIKKGDEIDYYYCETEYLIVEWWNGYIDMREGKLEDLYFIFLQKFKVPFEILKMEYLKVCDTNNKWHIVGNLPKVYIDFNQKLFINYFYDQALEARMITGWTGKYESFLHLIPEEYQYWVVDGIDYSKF